MKATCPLSRAQVVDRYFLEHRAKLLDLAAFLDRYERASSPPLSRGGAGVEDFRVAALRDAVKLLTDGKPQRARRILELLSDPTTDPIDEPSGKGAVGAYSQRK